MFKNILLPVDVDHLSADDDVCALATTLAGAAAHVTILHVSEPLAVLAAAGISEAELLATQNEIEARLRSVASIFESGDVKVVEGRPGGAIVAEAKHGGYDLIIMRGHRPGRLDILMGSSAKYVVSHASCAVFVLR